MSRPIFCPLCQRKNDPDATHCAYCGIKFVSDNIESLTTNKVSKKQSEILEKGAWRVESLPDLPAGDLALFIMDEEEPIIVEDVSQVIVGRYIEDSPVPVVDLTQYRGIEMGVSRRHMQITFADGQYSLMDLGSTNGTWLNRRRLVPSKPYRLHNNDQVLLGQLKMLVCFQAEASEETVQFVLSDQTTPETQNRLLTPEFLSAKILPYIETLIKLQHIIEASQGREPTEVHVEAIVADDRQPLVNVALTGAAGAVRLVEQRINPWREQLSNPPEEVEEEGQRDEPQELAPKIHQLAVRILAETMAKSADIDVRNLVDLLLPPLNRLVTGDITLSRELNESS